MAMYPKDLIELIRSRCNIADVVGKYITLRKAGGTLKGLCPFHKEKTPSFNVNEDRQIFHCFGCGEGGDVFKFIMLQERVDFPSAVRLLAEQTGVPLTTEQQGAEPRGPSKDILYRIHEGAAALYHQLLQTPAAGKARAYLAQRKLDGDIARDFQIGYAPEAWDTIQIWAAQKGFPAEALEASGLQSIGQNEGRRYDRFRDRVMFPIRDALGRVVAFSGRTLAEKSKQPKYVNSPETLLFHKGGTLFAIDRARPTIADTHAAVLCEGQIDCIRCHAAGFTNVVASQGTAFTEHHARLLKRFGADTVTIVLDADEAGVKATVASAEILLSAGFSVRAAALPRGEDPDSMILKNGPEAFREILDNAPTIIGFVTDILRQRGDMASHEGILRGTRRILAIIAMAPDVAQRELMLKELSQTSGISFVSLARDLAALRKKATPVPISEASPPPPTIQTTDQPIDERALIQIIIAHPQTLELVRQYLPVTHITFPHFTVILRSILAGDDIRNIFPEDPVGQRLVSELQMTAIQMEDSEDSSPSRAIRQAILGLWRKHFERRREALRRRLSSAPPEEQAQLDAHISQLTTDIASMRQPWDKASVVIEVEMAGETASTSTTGHASTELREE